jgi:ribosomal protein L28
MGLSSINVKAVSGGSEAHNQRTTKLNYVRQDLTEQNTSYKIKSIAQCKREIESKYFQSVGQKMQSKQTPIREGVLLIDAHHTAEDLKRVASALELEFGIKTIQAYVHKDEGHFNEAKVWKPNLHAHMVFDWTDQNGKSLKLKRDDMSKMQDIVADTLGLERGVASTKKHIDAKQYKIMKLEEELERKYDKELILKDNSELKDMNQDMMIELQRLQSQNALYELNLKYVQSKSDDLEKKLELLQEKVKKQGKGYSM